MTLRSLFTAGALVSLGMLFGRVLGLLREMLLAGSFGAGREADFAIMLLLIPDYITLTLIGGGASATLIPAFAKANREQSLELFWQALLISVALFFVIAVAVFFCSGHLADAVTAQGHGWVLFLFLLSLPMTAANSVLTAWLQYRSRFTVPAFANSIFNIVIIVSLWLAPLNLSALAGSIFLAVFVRLCFHAAAFYRADGFLPNSIVMMQSGWRLDRKLLKSYLSTATSNIFSMFPQYAPYIALGLAGSGIAIFNYAFKLITTPAMLVQVSIQTVLLPWLVQRRADGRMQDSAYGITLQCAWLLSIAMCLSLMLASREVAALCFQYGKMTGADVDAVGQMFAIGIWALPGMVLSTLWQQIHYSHSQPRAPLVANGLLALLVIPFCMIGELAFGLLGMVMMFVVIQCIPVWWLAKEGARMGMIASSRPSKTYVVSTTAAFIVWAVLALVYRQFLFAPLQAVMVCMVIGGITLLAGLVACAPFRQWVRYKAA